MCVCMFAWVFGRAGNPRSLRCSPQFSGMHLSPTLNQSGVCDSDQVPRLRWHTSRAGYTHTHMHTHTHTHAHTDTGHPTRSLKCSFIFPFFFNRSAVFLCAHITGVLLYTVHSNTPVIPHQLVHVRRSGQVSVNSMSDCMDWTSASG